MSYRNCLLLIFSAGAVLMLNSCQKQDAKPVAAAGPPVVPVTITKVSQESVPTELRVVGSVEASAIVQVKSQIAGELVKVAFTEGQNVNKGDLMFEIDPRPYQDALRQAEAAVTRDRAQITQAEAALARDTAQAQFAQTDASRYAELQKAGVVSRSQADQSRTTADVSREAAKATQATIDSAKGALKVDEAAVEAAKLNLSYCEIRAPLSGRTGNLLVHGGNLVKANDVPLVVIHQVTPIFANFNIPEQHLASVRRLSANHKLPVRVYTQDNPNQAVEGFLSVIDNTVDSQTGTIHLKATFDNREARLWPGQFVTAVLTLDTIQNATVVPSEAVQAGQQGQFVYVVDEQNRVAPRVVATGRAFGKKMIVEKGLVPGDTIVVDGQLRLFPGATIKPVEPGKQDGQS